MNSMTGFGSADYTSESGVQIHVDISSYNKKQLDIRLHLPPGLAAYESGLRKMVSGKVFRGSVGVKVEITPGENALNSYFEVNRKLAAAYVKSANRLKERLNLSGNVDINEVLKVPGVLTEAEFENLVSETDLQTALEAALNKLLGMRKTEGDELRNDISSRIDTLASILASIEPLTGKIPEIHRERLMTNLKNSGLDLSSDDERVLKEVIIFTDRYDVSEEITRIKSHFAQFAKLLEDTEPVGRAMEFLLQELQREINTLGTKSAHSDISPYVVKFKTELEKIREQVQNVE